jgi:uncharacterized protein
MAPTPVTADGPDFRRRALPGVFLEPVQARPAADWLTGVPAFVGFVGDGGGDRVPASPSRPPVCRRWEEALAVLHRGGTKLLEGSYLPHAIKGFFENGGKACVVVPIAVTGPEQCSAEALLAVFTADGVLDNCHDVDLICVPDAMMKVLVERSRDDVLRIQQAVLDHCRRMGNRFAVLDAFRATVYGHADGPLSEPFDAVSHWQRLPGDEGALYYPWVKVRASAQRACFIPPCGHVAGVFARTDRRVVIPKAPANVELDWALDLEVGLSDDEHARLNEVGVNCLRSYPRRGIRIWGARTLSRKPNWRYVNTRRIFLMLSRWIEGNLQDLVFEPNTPALWRKIEDRVSGYCYGLFRKGMLQGIKPAEAFFVKCDEENNPSQAYEMGQVICDVGLAPLVPAEFIVVRIAQSNAGTTVMVSEQ